MSIGVGAFLAMNVMMLSFVLYSGRGAADRDLGESWVRWALLTLATPALILLGLPFVARGLGRLSRRHLDSDVLVFAGVLAAFAISAHSVFTGHGPLYLDTAMGIMLFVTVGRYLEAAARARTTDALSALVRQMPEEAARVRAGQEETVRVDDLVAGDLVRIRPGERIPVDGIIHEGGGSVSEAEITGESVPEYRGPGSRVAAGTLNLDGSLLVEAKKTGSETTLARLVRLVDEARGGRYTLAPMVDRLTTVFLPIVLVLAAGTFIFWSARAGTGEGLMNGLSVLLIACPCAIGIAIPLASTAAIGRAASAGVLIRSGEVLEPLARTKRVFFDKTGTLTLGQLSLVEVRPAAGISELDLLSIAASLEVHSEHPIAHAVRHTAKDKGAAIYPLLDFRAAAGKGVEGRIAPQAGKCALTRSFGLLRAGTATFCGEVPLLSEPGASVVQLSSDGEWLGALVFRDQPRPSAAATVEGLSENGIAVELLSGDQAASVQAFLHLFPGMTSSSELSPEEKLERIRESSKAGEFPIMVGDGINDALALSGAAVGVTLESGTDLAREVSDVTILGGDLRRLVWVIDLAVRAMRTARINLFWAFFYNMIGLGLAVAGFLHPLFGAVAMILSSLLVVLHSQRLTRIPLPSEASAL